MGGGACDRDPGRSSGAPARRVEIRVRQSCSRSTRPCHALFHRPRVRPADAILWQARRGVLGPRVDDLWRRIGAKIWLWRDFDPNTAAVARRDDRTFRDSVHTAWRYGGDPDTNLFRKPREAAIQSQEHRKAFNGGARAGIGQQMVA